MVHLLTDTPFHLSPGSYLITGEVQYIDVQFSDSTSLQALQNNLWQRQPLTDGYLQIFGLQRQLYIRRHLDYNGEIVVGRLS